MARADSRVRSPDFVQVSLDALRRTYVPQLVATAGRITADLQALGVSAQG